MLVNKPTNWENAKQFCEDVDGVLLFPKTWSSIDLWFHDLIYGFMGSMDGLGYMIEII